MAMTGRKPPPVLPRAVAALREFFRLEAAAGILLIGAAVLALVFANSPLVDAYNAFRALLVQVRIGQLDIAKPLLLWINDGLMAVFFLLVALEIKREVLSGQLSTRAQITLPFVCAFAGVVVPAAIYWLINRGDPVAMQGWAVPAATDIAFALGILALLGSRAPPGMKILLSTIAVVDDLIAIVIIAMFYTHKLSLAALAWAGAALGLMVLLNRRGVRAIAPYLLLGAVMWVCVLKSGVHATLAGVATGLLIPHVRKGDAVPDEIEHSPLETLEHNLHPLVAYVILPLFAFANSGLVFANFQADDLLSPVALGVALGLLLGKPIGIVGAALLARALGIVQLPRGMDNKSLLGLGLLCGIGFTMSLFISSLAFSDDGHVYDISVLGILLASTIAAVLGLVWSWLTLPRQRTPG
ncbi:Na+/H+ antiporter NhaA [Vulcaniibacterium gelatinicum]|uniref:Na+/H+ antiporter NhaA n=1 Tax=Vulcaniibacterium gelatinicum TaxID=2598725 RepID=UPI001FE3C379|nr:Na+/H+ antiporter NhaA [Vulcaniibacterium gelatinicum]